jgi:hypothetical protein
VRSLSERWLKGVPALKDVAMRVQLVATDLTESELPDLAEALETTCMLAEQAEPRAREVLAAAMPTLTDPVHDELVERLRHEANESGHFALARLLRRRARPAAFPEQPPEPDQRHPGEARVGRALTLGERKALARSRDRFMLDRLLRDPHPLVIRNVLANARITEDDVVRLAARRPAFPDVQTEIAKHTRWSTRGRVRVALVQNPFTPPSVSVPLLALLVRPELEQVVGATDVPAIVRGAALDLLERRPPVPSPDDPPLTQ